MKKFAIPAAIFILAIYFGFAFLVFPFGEINELDIAKRGQIGDTFGALNALVSSLGLVGILATLYHQREDLATQARNNIEEVAERRSLFNLEAAIKAHDEALKLLNDGNNDRATWLRAGRILRHGKVLADGVTVKEHKLALELRLLDYRSAFRNILDQPAEFFYGVPEEDRNEGIEHAAMRSSAATPDTPTLSETRWLEEKSINAVWEASVWPDDYADPLTDNFDEGAIEVLMFTARGLREYLLHRKQWVTRLGKLGHRTNPFLGKQKA